MPTTLPVEGDAWARLARAGDWAATPLGAVAEWPVALRQAAALCLDSPAPAVLGWGHELVLIGNEGAWALCGVSGTALLGVPLREASPALRDVLGPPLGRALLTREGASFAAQPWAVERCGYAEERYLAGSVIPIRSDDGTVGGALAFLREETAQVLRERRLRLLHELALACIGSRMPGAACLAVAGALATAPADLPFALLYLLEGEAA